MTDIKEHERVYLPSEVTVSQDKAIWGSGQIIVSAAAGSGKTSTMISRILRLIIESALSEDERISLKDMLILVYNNAAADELREKLHRALYQAVLVLDGEVQNVLKRELDELSFAHISTIHAYCQSLIKDNFNYLGISPTFEVLDEDEHKEYMYQALENVFDAYDKKGDETFEKIVQIFSQRRKEDNLKDNIIKLFQIIDIQPNQEEFYNNVHDCYNDFEHSKFLNIILDFEHNLFAKAKEVLEPCKLVFEKGADEGGTIAKYLNKIVNAYYYADQLSTVDNFGDMCRLAASFQKVDASTSSKKWDPEFIEYGNIAKICINEMTLEIEDLAEFAGKEEMLKKAHSASGVLIDKLIEITQNFEAELNRLKNEDNVLAFEDLQHKTVELLKNEEAPIKKFKHVFVDEYQDVNPTQEYIISNLIDKDCFMVGDTKQSIYGFRLADPTNFLRRQARYESGDGTAINFNRNFRSGKQILEFVNSIFNVIMTKDTADVDYAKEAKFELKKVEQHAISEMHLFCYDKKGNPDVNGVYDITLDDGKEKSLTSADCEGIFVARKIRELVGNARKTDGFISYGDITIIIRNRSTSAQRIISQLKEAGIPIDDSGFEKSKSEPECDLIQFLRTIDNPRQDIPFVGFLLSFFGGYTEQELATIAEVEAPTFYDKFVIYEQKGDALADKIKVTNKLLQKYRIKASFKNVKELASGIVSDFSYDAYLGKYGEADIYGLKAFVAGISDKDNESLGRFLRNYTESPSKKSSSTKSDRVHISTIHGYKGLESEVVFVCGLDSSFSLNDTKGDLIVDSQGYISLNYFDFDKNEKSDKTISRFAAKKLNNKKTIGEEMRLLYVALTRAKHYMYVTSSISKSKLECFGKVISITPYSSMLDMISDAIAKGANITYTVHRNEEFALDLGHDQKHDFPAPNKTIQAAIENAQAYVYPYKVATELAIKYSASATDVLDEQAIKAYSNNYYKNVGTTYHRIMQYIDFNTSGVDEVKNEINRLIEEKYLTEDEVKDAREADGKEFEKNIARCLNSSVMRYALKFEKLGKCQREKAFMMYGPANDVRKEFGTDEKVLVQGVLDLFIDGDKKIIVDFKHSSLRDENELNNYKEQLKLYKMAIERAFNVNIDKTLLYSFTTGKTINSDDFTEVDEI